MSMQDNVAHKSSKLSNLNLFARVRARISLEEILRGEPTTQNEGTLEWSVVRHANTAIRTIAYPTTLLSYCGLIGSIYGFDHIIPGFKVAPILNAYIVLVGGFVVDQFGRRWAFQHMTQVPTLTGRDSTQDKKHSISPLHKMLMYGVGTLVTAEGYHLLGAPTETTAQKVGLVGLSASVVALARTAWKLSKDTFTHQGMRTIANRLIDQVAPTRALRRREKEYTKNPSVQNRIYLLESQLRTSDYAAAISLVEDAQSHPDHDEYRANGIMGQHFSQPYTDLQRIMNKPKKLLPYHKLALIANTRQDESLTNLVLQLADERIDDTDADHAAHDHLLQARSINSWIIIAK